MAIRREDLRAEDAVIYAFPLDRAQASRRAARLRARRRRTIGIATVLAALGLLIGGQGGPASAEGPRPPPRTVVVRPGDTPWAIAERYAPDGVDPRTYVDALVAHNGLDRALAVGEEIELPR